MKTTIIQRVGSQLCKTYVSPYGGNIWKKEIQQKGNMEIEAHWSGDLLKAPQLHSGLIRDCSSVSDSSVCLAFYWAAYQEKGEEQHMGAMGVLCGVQIRGEPKVLTKMQLMFVDEWFSS